MAAAIVGPSAAAAIVAYAGGCGAVPADNADRSSTVMAPKHE